MRILTLLSALLLSACGLKRMLPEGPVLKPDERDAAFGQATASAATYTSQPLSDVPVMPFMVWGVAYDLDIVVVTEHPEWDMTEIARIDTPTGPLWMAKDARRVDLEQIIVADIPDLFSWMPEIPVQRVQGAVRIEDRSSETDLDMDVFYSNPDGEPVHINYQGKVPAAEQGKRNGSTMGHSQGTVMAVLDLPLRNLARSATVRINGETQKIRKIAGLVPFAMALTQTQAGIAIADVAMTPLPQPFPDAPTADVSVTHQLAEGRQATQTWHIGRAVDGARLVQRSALRTIEHRFVGTHSLEWTGATVQQSGKNEPALVISANPALPDLRRRFDGVMTSRFVMDIAGQQSHATGEIHVQWVNDEAVVRIRPDAPWWVAERPMDSRITRTSDGVTLRTERVDTE
jgi:hypothetical protein